MGFINILLLWCQMIVFFFIVSGWLIRRIFSLSGEIIKIIPLLCRFESVYLDNDIRVAKDIRGDYLVVERAPHEWKE